MDVTEHELLERTLAEARGNLSEAARRLGISRMTFKRRMDRILPATDDEVEAPASKPGQLAETWRTLQAARARQDDEERRLVASVLEAAGGVVSRAARALGMPRTTLIGRLQALGLEDAGHGSR